MNAIYPGSFDPITLGHVSILKRAMFMFDKIFVVVADNSSKKYLFDSNQRLNMVELAIDPLNTSTKHRLVADYTPGTIADYIRKNKIDVIIRGVRSATDLDYEIKMEQYNRTVSFAETIYMSPLTEHMNTSSSLVRMFLQTNKIEATYNFLPPQVVNYITFLKGRG